MAGYEGRKSGSMLPHSIRGFAILAHMSSGPNKLFLVDAMAHVYRAFFAPMPQRLTGPGGVPTNVPFLFGNILRRLIKDYQPDYIGIVFDPPGATFRDKLFEKYKAQRQPMPDEMRVQLPFVRRLCEAMRLAILELPGYEADDVIGAIAAQAAKQNVEVLIISNDKDMMQLVNGGVRILRTGSGGAKDPNEKPAKGERRKPGIGEVGARELIQQFGSVEETLRRAGEVKRANYREALQKYGKFVLLSKELAKISTDIPFQISLPALALCEPDVIALAGLYRELGFSSLLKELGADATAPPAPADTEP